MNGVRKCRYDSGIRPLSFFSLYLYVIVVMNKIRIKSEDVDGVGPIFRD